MLMATAHVYAAPASIDLAADGAAAYDAWVRDTNLSAVLRVVEVTAGSTDAPRYVLRLALTSSPTNPRSPARATWNAFRASAAAVGVDIESRLVVKFAHILEVPVADVAVVVRGDDACWSDELTIDKTGLHATEQCCSSAVEDDPPMDTIWNASRRFGARTARPRHATLDPERAAIEERLVRGDAHLTDQVLALRLGRYFGGRGRYRLLTRSEHLTEAVVEDLRGEVLPGDQRWERLQIAVFTAEAPDGRLQVVLVADGQYGTGMGTRAPNPRSLRDMEPDYASALSAYAKALLEHLVAPTR
jgi:hypothetical protein